MQLERERPATDTEPRPGDDRPPRRRMLARRRRAAAAAIVLIVGVIGGVALLGHDDVTPLKPRDLPGTTEWAVRHYGNPDAHGYRARHIVQIDFLGTTMFVNKAASPHFLRLARIFEARAPEYAAAVASGTPDDWSYANRDIRGESSKSYHAFGLAVDVNALTNVLGTAGDMPSEVVEEWEREGGAWGGHFDRPDPMHFESHLTPGQVRHRYEPDGTVKPDYLQELVGG